MSQACNKCQVEGKVMETDSQMDCRSAFLAVPNIVADRLYILLVFSEKNREMNCLKYLPAVGHYLESPYQLRTRPAVGSVVGASASGDDYECCREKN
jgi:hypothetical protein